MAKIAEMSNEELKEAMTFMTNVPTEDPCFSGWNFDPEEYKSKFNELIDEAVKRTENNNGKT